jgi:hypothetical protein
MLTYAWSIRAALFNSMAAADTIRTLQLSANPKIVPAIKPPPEHTSVTPSPPAPPLQTTVAAGCGGGGVGGDAGSETSAGTEGSGGGAAASAGPSAAASAGPSVGKTGVGAEGVTVGKVFLCQ